LSKFSPEKIFEFSGLHQINEYCMKNLAKD